MSTALHGRRRILRWVRNGAIALVALVVVAVVAGIITVHTDWGRDYVRRQLVSAVQKSFRGPVTIGRLEGSPFGTMVARDVVIDDADGRPAVKIDRVALHIKLLGLVRKQLHLSELDLDGVTILARDAKDGKLNLAELTVPNDTKSPGTWGVSIDEVALRGGAIDYAAGGQVFHLDKLSIDGGLNLPASAPLKTTLRVRGTWREGNVPVILATSLSKSSDRLEIGALQAAIGEVAVIAKDVKVAGARASGRFFVAASAKGVHVLAPDAPLAGDVALSIDLKPLDGREDSRSIVILAGLAGGATLDGGGLFDTRARHVEAALRVHGVDVARLLRGGATTALDGVALVDVTQRPNRAGLAALTGGVHVVGGGAYQDARFDVLDVGVALDGGAVAATVKAAAPGRTAVALDAHAIVGEAKAGGRPPIELREATLAVRTEDLGRAAHGLIPVRGALAIDLIASGRVVDGEPSLSAQGRVVGSDLHVKALAAKRLSVDLDGSGLPYRPTGHVRLEVDQLSNAGRPMIGQLIGDARSRADRRIDVQVDSRPATGPWRIQLGANVGVAKEKIDVALGEHRLRTKGLDWSGRGGTIVIEPTTIVARGVSTNLATGHVALDATYHRAGARQGDADARVALQHLDLAEIDRSFDLGGVYQGTADGTFHVTREGSAIRAQVDAGARGLVARLGAPPLDVRTRADVAPGKVTLDAEVAGGKLGAVALAVDIDAPRRLEDQHAWKHLDRHAVHAASITFEHLDVKQIGAALGDDDVRGGRIDGKLSFDDGVPAGELRAQGIDAPELPSPLDARVSLGGDGRIASVLVDATERNLARARAIARLALPEHPFTAGDWDMDPDDFFGAHLRIEGDLKDQELVRRIGLAGAAYHGKGSIDVDVAPQLTKGTMNVRMTGFHGATIVEPIDADVAITVDPNGVAGRLTTVFQKRPLLQGQFGTSTKPKDILAALRSKDPGAIRALPIDAMVTMERIQIADLLHTLGRSGEKTQGEASLRVALGGTVGDPHGNARIWFDGLGTEKVVLDQLVANADWQGKTLDVKVDGNERGGGKLALTAKAELDKLETATARIQATKFDIAPIARLLPPSVGIAGVIDADMDLTGASFATGKVGGRLHVAQGALPLHPLVGTLRGADITVTAQGDGVNVKAKGLIGRGTIDLNANTTLAGLLPTKGGADITIHQVTMINEAQPKIDGIAHVDLGKDGDTWTVNVDMRRVFVTLPDQKGQKLHPVGIPGDVVFIENGRPPPKMTAPPPKKSAVIGQRPSAPFLIATIDLGQVRVDSKELRGLIMGKITATVGPEAIAIDGTIDAGRADVTLSDRRYRVDHALVRFDGSADPLLDVRLVHDFAEVTLYVNLRGRLSDPKLELASDPNTYSQSELLGFLIGGEPGAPPAQGVADVASGIASSFLSNKVKAYAQQWTGVSFDVLKFEAATSTSSAALTIGKWVSQKLFVEYRQRVDGRFDENASEAEVEYWLGRRVVVDGTAGDRGVDGVDLIWTRRW